MIDEEGQKLICTHSLVHLASVVVFFKWQKARPQSVVCISRVVMINLNAVLRQASDIAEVQRC